MGRTATFRIVFDSLILGALFFLPWWATALASLVAVMFLPHFYEILFVGAFFDFVYRPAPAEFPDSFLMLIGAAVLLAVATILRERLISSLYGPAY